MINKILWLWFTLIGSILITSNAIAEQQLQMGNPFQKNRNSEKIDQVKLGLNHYSLKEITILGVIGSKKMEWLVVLAPTKKIHYLKKQDVLGKELAIIVNITLEEIFLKFSASAEDFLKENALKMGITKMKSSEDIFVLPIIRQEIK